MGEPWPRCAMLRTRISAASPWTSRPCCGPPAGSRRTRPGRRGASQTPTGGRPIRLRGLFWTSHRRNPGGKVDCCAVIDAYFRLVVGWSIADHMRTELVVDALQMALSRRHPGEGSILHSDRYLS